MPVIFVYGTLLQGMPLFYALKEAVKLDHGYLRNAELFDLGDYPGLKAGVGNVIGEIYQIDQAILKSLDQIEGYNPVEPTLSLFLRHLVEIQGLSGKKYQAFTYYYAEPVKAGRIDGGDYRRYLSEKKICYLAYGSNMSKERLEKRVGFTGEGTPVLLHGYELLFNKNKAKANLMCRKEASTPAVLWRLSPDQMTLLDRNEGVPNHYLRLAIAFRLEQQWTIGQIYLAHPDQLTLPEQPEGEYLQHIKTGYRENGFDTRLLAWATDHSD